MNPVALAGPAVEPVSLAEMKIYLRVETADEDDLVSGLVVAARLLVERTCRLALVEQTWRVSLDAWPEGRRVALPFAPLREVTAVRIRNADGAPTLLDAAVYRLDTSRDPPALVADVAAAAPGVPIGGIEIDATFGFGPDAGSVPAPLRLAIKRLVASLFENRGDRTLGGAALPTDVRALLAPFARPRLA